MEFIKPIQSRRSHIMELSYHMLNIGMAVAVLLTMLSTQAIWIPLLIVVLSKWRVLAVRPRYWRANILANLVDIIVGLSFVVLLYQGLGAFWFQVGLTLAYIVWLVFIKPRSKRVFVVAQSIIAVFFGVAALSSIAYDAGVALFVVVMWVIGYAALRHVMLHYGDPLAAFISLVGGLILAQLGWFGYHWLFAYTVPGISVHVAQLAIIATLLVFMTERVYDAYHKKQEKLKLQDVIIPIVFSVLLIGVILVVFNHISPTGSL